MSRTSDAAPGTPATAALLAAGITFTTHGYHHDAAAASFGGEAATALNVPPERVFKTLLAQADGAVIVGIVPVSSRLNLKALAATTGHKRAQLADPALAQRKTGYVLGGISPIGQKSSLPTVLDDTAELFDTIFVSGGRRGFDIELAPADLLAITSGTLAPIGR